MPKLFVAFLLSLFTLSLAAQEAVDPKKAEAAEKLRKDAVEFLRETSQDVGRMRSVENRISFSAELASLMWFHNEKEARAMFGASIVDFKQLLAQLDAEMNAVADPGEDDDLSGGIFAPGQSPAQRKFRVATAVRQQIALSVAEHDADLAFAFFYETAGMISNPKFREETERADKSFEHQLLTQIAETNAAKAAQAGIASLKNGVKNSHVDLLQKIYAKDAEKGAEFGAAILSRLRSDKKSVDGHYVFNSLLSFGRSNLEASQKPGGKKAVYSRNDLRDIADQFAQILLEMDAEDGHFTALSFVGQIEEFAPSRAAQIRSKFGARAAAFSNANSNANMGGSGGLYTGTTSSNSNSANGDFEKRLETEKQMVEALKNLGKPLPKEDRDKIVAQARKIIAETKGKDKKILGLTGLASQVAMAGDKELADEIMRDAERLVNPQPRNYQDFMFSWILASGYSHANPDKAFPILEGAILRANETIAAFVKVAEFVDVQQEMIDDGEVQIGMFGGSMIRGMTQELGGMADSTLIALARADFVKTKGLTNSFERIEIRVLAKMLVLRAVLDDKKPKRSRDVELVEATGI